MYEIESFHHFVVTNATCQGYYFKKIVGENTKYN